MVEGFSENAGEQEEKIEKEVNRVTTFANSVVCALKMHIKIKQAGCRGLTAALLHSLPTDISRNTESDRMFKHALHELDCYPKFKRLH